MSVHTVRWSTVLPCAPRDALEAWERLLTAPDKFRTNTIDQRHRDSSGRSDSLSITSVVSIPDLARTLLSQLGIASDVVTQSRVVIDHAEHRLVTSTRNVTGSKLVRVVDRTTYAPHGSDGKSTAVASTLEVDASALPADALRQLAHKQVVAGIAKYRDHLLERIQQHCKGRARPL